MLDDQIPLEGDIAAFAIATVVISIAGVKATGLADRLADRSGMGEAVTGTVFLGFLTALPGLLASVVAAARGHPAMAVSNAMGGIAVQTAALAVADIAYRRSNLEHAAASVPNMMQATILIALMVLVLCGFSGPDVTVLHIHPVTFLLIFAAGGAFRLVVATRDDPMWKPTETTLTVTDKPDDDQDDESMAGLITRLVIAAGLTGISGAVVAHSAGNIVQKTGFSEVIVGTLFVAVATSLPELVTSVTAVRRGALTLAVSDIVGGNFFDVLFIAAADLAYLNGSIFHADGIGTREIFLTSITILLNIVLLAGLIFRQKRGPGNIGFESVLMLLLYFGGLAILSLAM